SQRTRRMIIGAVVAIETVAGRIDLNLDARAVVGAECSDRRQRRERIALAEMHQDRTSGRFSRERQDLRWVVADRSADVRELRSRKPGDGATPAEAERRDLAGRSKCFGRGRG